MWSKRKRVVSKEKAAFNIFSMCVRVSEKESVWEHHVIGKGLYSQIVRFVVLKLHSRERCLLCVLSSLYTFAEYIMSTRLLYVFCSVYTLLI